MRLDFLKLSTCILATIFEDDACFWENFSVTNPKESIMKKYSSGVLFGDELEALYNDAKENEFALPAVNTIGTNSINATLETAAKVNSPVIIQFSNGGAQFIAGKGMPNDQLQANISGAISGALHVHNVAKY